MTIIRKYSQWLLSAAMQNAQKSAKIILIFITSKIDHQLIIHHNFTIISYYQTLITNVYITFASLSRLVS